MQVLEYLVHAPVLFCLEPQPHQLQVGLEPQPVIARLFKSTQRGLVELLQSRGQCTGKQAGRQGAAGGLSWKELQCSTSLYNGAWAAAWLVLADTAEMCVVYSCRCSEHKNPSSHMVVNLNVKCHCSPSRQACSLCTMHDE